MAAVARPAVAERKPEKARVVLAVAAKGAFHDLPLTIADQLGYFRAEGLEIEWLDLGSAPQAAAAANLPGIDVVSGPYEQVLSLHARGQPVQAFVSHGRAPQIALGISSRTLPGFRNWLDLRGRRLGITAAGSTSHRMASLLLQRAGLKPAEVSFVSLGMSAAAATAVRTSQVDAICHLDPVITMLEQKGDVKIVADTRTLRGTQAVFGGPMPAGCLYAPPEFLQRHPATVQALTHAVVHALKWLQTAGPSDIIKTVPEAQLLGDRALYLASFNKSREALSLDGVLSEDAARTARKVLADVDASIQTNRLDIGKTYTNQFAQRAKEKFKL